MAKKRKKIKEKEEEEKYEFVPPEFDEKQFLKDEMKNTKRILLIVGYGILFGVLAAILTVTTGAAALGLLMVLIGFGSMKIFFQTLKIDISKFTRRNWIESGAWFFFTFLAIWVLVVNPPFVDYAPPDINDVQIVVYTSTNDSITYNYTYYKSNGTHLWVHPAGTVNIEDALISAYYNGYMVNVTAKVTDNGVLSGAPEIIFRQESENEVQYVMTEENSSHIYTYTISSLSGYLKGNYFTFRIVAEDKAGHVRIFTLPTNAEIRVLT